MSDMSTAPTPAAIEWQKPVINDSYQALEQTLSRIERLGVLLNTNNFELLDNVVSEKATPKCAEDIWSIYVLAAEKLDEINDVVGEIIEALLKERAPSVSSVGKHTDLMRRRAFEQALAAYEAAEAVPTDANTPDEVIDAAADAFKVMIETRAPDLDSLARKVEICASTGAFQTDFVLPALMKDMKALAARVEG